MKIMKENRDSVVCRTQIEDLEPHKLQKKESGPLYTSNSSADNFSLIQRTKDEDWKAIFDLYEKYIKLIVKK